MQTLLIEISAKRYGIDALGAMAQGLFCSLLIGTIINTLGTQLNIPYLNTVGRGHVNFSMIATVNHSDCFAALCTAPPTHS